ncbi:hypothetical protein BRAS3843_1640030 [Bradyrhizobium sp. STM 3843]|nr:hypothetical protein BRAS3843_1640030 [Bradyrhizobium sp. STM 3843]
MQTRCVSRQGGAGSEFCNALAIAPFEIARVHTASELFACRSARISFGRDAGKLTGLRRVHINFQAAMRFDERVAPRSRPKVLARYWNEGARA